MQNARQGAQTQIMLTASDDVENVTGKYFSDCRVSAKPTALSLSRVNKIKSKGFERPLISESYAWSQEARVKNSQANDPELARLFWQYSEKCVGLNSENGENVPQNPTSH
jgi:hypothetical protein